MLGQVLAIRSGEAWVGGTIVETEAYLGVDDPASHSHRGPTARSSIMFGPPGMAYVYFIYGMHHCLNAVTEPEGSGTAVLVRALRPAVPEGVEVAALACGADRLRGPGLLCREMGVTLAMNGWDLTSGDLTVVGGEAVSDAEVLVGPRVGIRQAADLPLRFRLSPAAVGRRSTPRSSARHPRN
ncbi:MAG: DNA-3-methyladenine glycosylase [Chloroflexota bacterium]|jgi:DNA-3-methyladenine glycosylase|nr:DNA-3-methyladenine glycosylase [Chloroflexota bacterium]